MARGAESSGWKTGDAEISSSHVLLHSYVIKIGTSDTTVIFKDTDTSGTIKWEDGGNGVTAAGDFYVRHTFNKPLAFPGGLFCDVTGTAAAYAVTYELYQV